MSVLCGLVFARVPGNNEIYNENSLKEDEESPVIVQLDEETILEAIWNYFRSDRSKRGIADYAQMGAGMVENKHYLSQGVEKGTNYIKGRTSNSDTAGRSTGGNVVPIKLGYITILSFLTFYVTQY